MRPAEYVITILQFIEGRIKCATNGLSNDVLTAYTVVLSDIFDDLNEIRAMYPTSDIRRSEEYMRVRVAFRQFSGIVRRLRNRTEFSQHDLQIQEELETKLARAEAELSAEASAEDNRPEILSPQTTLFEYRVTKYDPMFRDPVRGYTRNDWISVRDVGCIFDGQILTRAEYQRIEEAYCDSAIDFLSESGLSGLTVWGLWNGRNWSLPFRDGSFLRLDELRSVIGALLREEYGCRLEGATGFIHIGWDYYMYVGVPSQCPNAQVVAQSRGLFVETFDSPYRDRTTNDE